MHYNNYNNNNYFYLLLYSKTVTSDKVCPTLIFLSDVAGAMTEFKRLYSTFLTYLWFLFHIKCYTVKNHTAKEGILLNHGI
jgi:Na+-transporting methylmalonyl-CoA/oxaloacetate decarboxylase beta subunit